MHTELIKRVSYEQLKELFIKALDMVKESDEDLYDCIELKLYKEIYGCHFSDWLLKKATGCMKNEDGTYGGHWTLEDTTSVAKQLGITFDTFNEYDWNYVMNMVYSDYYKSIPDELSSYFKIAKAFIMDKDAPKGKAFLYYISMKDNY